MDWIEGDDAVAYEWTEKAYDHILSNRLAATVSTVDGVRVGRVQGACPRCGDRLDHGQAQEAVVLSRRVLSGSGTDATSEYVYVDLWCSCEQAHPGRPADRRGCGVAFRVPAKVTT